ncbi:MAG: NAD-dependent epimerase/dehydratase family protein [Candidatus Magasanikbacteria bacterium]|nr:NAD-dependent epimerase/dehydratase family protein [Candidatus Magasanikbacteria bacterium]
MSLYLVTGGAGFIGTNLVKKLLADGHAVRVLDNWRAGRFPERVQPGAEYLTGDIRNSDDVRQAMSSIEGVFHLAAAPRVPYSIEHPQETNEHNITGTLNVLVAARDAGVKRLVYSASSSVYGNLEMKKKLSESTPPHPLSPYALQKLAAEHYCRLFAELYGFPTVSLRYFNVYGSYLDPNGAYALVIGKFLRQRKAGEPLTICGDGQYWRDFTEVEDVVQANILAMTSPAVGKGEVINIGYGQARSVQELAALIGGPTVAIPERPGDPRFSEADNSLAKQLLNWQPTISLEEGIGRLKREWGIT